MLKVMVYMWLPIEIFNYHYRGGWEVTGRQFFCIDRGCRHTDGLKALSTNFYQPEILTSPV